MYQRQLSAVPFSLSLLTLRARVRVPSRCLSCASILLPVARAPPILASVALYFYLYIYMYIVYTPCDRSTCIDNETLETNRASKRSHLGDIDREMFHGYRRIYRTRSSAVKERRRRRVIIELRHDNIDRESGNGNSRGRINRYQFVPLPLAFPPEFSSSITGTVIVICRLSAIPISRCSRILSIFLSISKMLRPKMVNLSERDRKNGRIVARPPTPVPKIYRRRNEREDRVTRPKIVLVKPRDF